MPLKEWISSKQGKERRYLTRFSIGATLFFAGSGAMLFADNRISPSLTQEVVTLVGLAIATSGAIMSLAAYIMLTLLRLFSDTRND
ncbi:MAG: hypothetical protein CMH97_01915 [Oceanospirillaceae bacterium]|jgi:hypothetical protein|nr:hypothetical protein [Oceanospirillaceae bacterium]OUX66831.1 MAG: hypothetical protein CBE36_01305 [Oceanospirillaceae bacterium TMED276]|tara:strand:- start:17483 stop:17740 length:258 start_codon:yes stop_codon:yes gene_type:complete